MPTAIVTGASSGIGKELAILLAAAGTDLVLVARTESALRDLGDELTRRHGIRTWPVVADLAAANGSERVTDGVKAAGVEQISILVNNAGFGWRGEFAAMPTDRALEMIAVNVTALTHLTRLFLPGMIERRTGRILNIASTAAFQPGPLMAVYYATKAYVLSLSVALSVELEGTGVTCTALCPGPTATGFQRVAGTGGTALFSKSIVMDAKSVARAGYRGMMRGKAIVTPGWLNKSLAVATRFSPRTVAARAAKLSQEVRSKK